MRSSLSDPASPSTLNFQGVTVSLILAGRDKRGSLVLGPMGQAHCRLNSMTMTIAGRWPKSTEAYALSEVTLGWKGVAWLAFLGWVPKRGFVRDVPTGSSFVGDFLGPAGT